VFAKEPQHGGGGVLNDEACRAGHRAMVAIYEAALRGADYEGFTGRRRGFLEIA
jgi:hypothetical protein